MIVNLHGFNSSGNNNTFAQLKNFFEPNIKVISPTYTVHNFKKGFSELTKIVSEAIESEPPEKLLLIGSSTGAVFAEMLAKKFNGKVVLINPITNPETLKHHIGENTNFRTGEKYEFTLENLETFNTVKHDLKNISRLILVEKNETVINHDKTKKFYKGYGRYIEYDGDSHRFTFFGEALPEIREFYFSKP